MSAAVKHLEDYSTGTRYRATVVSSERITGEESEEVRELTLDVDRPDFPFLAGQSIGVIVPASPELGRAEHFRLYSVADLPERGEAGRPRIRICVRRCNYTDEYSGEEYRGIASNYLCDRRPGDTFSIAGPFGLPFEVPEEPDARLFLIGGGTGIAPFRALVKQIYRNVPQWKGRIWLFYGARSGLETLYTNDERDDLARYYDEGTFQAFKAVSPPPASSEPIAWDFAIQYRGEELWKMLGERNTYVYVVGLEEMLHALDEVFAELAGSEVSWQRRKAELVAEGRWVELIY
jgi:ferredoxin--NADP+ reductase